MSHTILVTGAAGYIGSHAAKMLLEQGNRVIAVDNLSTGKRQALEELNRCGDLIFFEGDLRDSKLLGSIFADYTVDAVMHFAAACNPNESVADPIKYYENNVLGTLVLLEAMKEAKVDKIIFSSTCSIYGDSENLPVTEETAAQPLNPYAHSKLMAEEAIRYYHTAFGISAVVFRYFNVCGASDDASIGDSKKPSILLVQNCVRGALGIEPFAYTCGRVNTPDTTPIRDYIDVRDLADAHLAALEYLGRHKGFELMNLGTGKGSSVREIVTNVERILGIPIEKSQARPRQGETAAIYANPAKAERVLGWKAERSLSDSVRALAAWYQKRPKGFSY